MAANPAQVATARGELVPAPFIGETFVLSRPGVMLELHGVRTANGKWSTRGTLFLSNIRMVFTAEHPDPSGLAGYDLPLVYIRNDTLNQPIFGCNNLSGEVWPAVEGGGPAGSLPPHKFIVYFKEGGIGTFYPLYYTLAQRAKEAFSQQQPGAQREPNPAPFARSLATAAFVDPNDPSIVYLTPPTDDNQTLPSRPKYAANYGQDEVYEDIAPGHGRDRAAGS